MFITNLSGGVRSPYIPSLEKKGRGAGLLKFSRILAIA